MLVKADAIKMIKGYLEKSGIHYEAINELKKPVLLSNVDCIVIPCPADKVIGSWIEVQLRFREEHIYMMAYYSQIFATEEKYGEIIRLLNHMNVHLGYETMLQHMLALDENTGDIYNGVQIRYETLEQYFYEVMDYILNFQKQLLEDICIPLVMLQSDEWNLSKAKKYIDFNLMGKSAH